jgi:dTMP kinase
MINTKIKIGKFITIEGIEGAGKSTALQFIRNYFIKKNIEIILTREPGGTPLAETFRQLLLFPVEQEFIQIETELLLIFAGRSQHLQQLIKPALYSGKWVLSDRYIDATYAYQGGGRGIDKQFISLLDKWIVGDYYPDLTFLLDVPVDLGLKRAEKRGEKDRIEKETVEFFTRIREVYLERAVKDKARVKVIDASQSIENVQGEISKYLEEFFIT